MRPSSLSPQALRALPKDRYELRDRNQAEVFATILTQGPISRVEIAHLTQLSQATVSKVVDRLLQRKVLQEAGTSGRSREGQDKTVGRPARALWINERRYYAVGVRIAAHEEAGPGGRLVGVVTTLSGKVVKGLREERAFPSTDPQALVREVASLTTSLLTKRATLPEIIGVGVELGGHVSDGAVRMSPNLRWGYEKQDPSKNDPGVLLADMLRRATGHDVVVENDVNALAVREQWFGGGWAHRSFAVVWVGMGIGAGLVIDNELVHGASGGAGEFGHVVVDSPGQQCRCGAYGCLETVAAIPSIVSQIKGEGYVSAMGMEQTIDTVRRLAQEDDSHTRAVFDRAADALGRALSVLVNTLAPNRIMLTGPAVMTSAEKRESVLFSDHYMAAMKSALARHTFPTLRKDCELVVEPHTDEDVAQGAASMVLREFIANPMREPSR